MFYKEKHVSTKDEMVVSLLVKLRF